VATVIARTNQAYAAFLRSSEGTGFCGQVREALHCGPGCGPAWVVTSLSMVSALTQVVLIGDGVGGILGFDALCHSASMGTGSRGSSRRGSMVSVAKPSLLRRGVVSPSLGLCPWNMASLHAGRSQASSGTLPH
jgi:hypothetical protein